MKKIFFLFIILNITFGYSQNQLLNDDGTISNYAKRQYFVETFNKISSDETRYDIDEKYLVVITKDKCEDDKYEKKELSDLRQ